MRSMAIERRDFLVLAAGLALAPIARAEDLRPQGYLTSRRMGGRDACVWLNEAGQEQAWFTLPRRGHSFAIDARHGRAVVFGRQPGFFAYGFDLQGQGELPAQALPLPTGRHFYGHGVFSPDGNVLYATENDFEQARGVVGIYDARPGQQYRRIGEFETHGVGPHELVLMPDGRSLCVANGGMETHPDYGKTLLNAATMHSTLVYLDRETGKLLASHELGPEWQRLSMRHLAVDGAGKVWVGCQYASTDGRRPDLVLHHERGQPLTPAQGPEDMLRAMNNYVGSVTASGDGTVVATSSPLGGRVAFWETGTGRLLQMQVMHDVCGVAPIGPQGFLLSSGNGSLQHYQLQPCAASQPACLPSAQAIRQVDGAWDNHMRRI